MNLRSLVTYMCLHSYVEFTSMLALFCILTDLGTCKETFLGPTLIFLCPGCYFIIHHWALGYINTSNFFTQSYLCPACQHSNRNLCMRVCVSSTYCTEIPREYFFWVHQTVCQGDTYRNVYDTCIFFFIIIRKILSAKPMYVH